MVRAREKIIINIHTASSQSTKWLMKQIKQNITYTIPLKIQKKVTARHHSSSHNNTCNICMNRNSDQHDGQEKSSLTLGLGFWQSLEWVQIRVIFLMTLLFYWTCGMLSPGHATVKNIYWRAESNDCQKHVSMSWRKGKQSYENNDDRNPCLYKHLPFPLWKKGVICTYSFNTMYYKPQVSDLFEKARVIGVGCSFNF